MINLLLVTVALASFVIYGVAIKRLFSADHGVDMRMQVLKVCGIVFAIVHLVSIWRYEMTNYYLFILALGAYLLGLGVFLSAWKSLSGYRLTLAFSPDTPERILNQGVYARIRHPFYLAYSLTWLGGALAAPSAWTLSTMGIMLLFYWWAARLEERKFLASSLGDSYRNYMRHAGMFFPMLARSAAADTDK